MGGSVMEDNETEEEMTSEKYHQEAVETHNTTSEYF